MRIYLVMRLATQFTRWRSKKAASYCNREGIEADTMFALKCLMQDQPYLILGSAFIASSLFFGFAVRQLERPYYDDETGGLPTSSPYF